MKSTLTAPRSGARAEEGSAQCNIYFPRAEWQLAQGGTGAEKQGGHPSQSSLFQSVFSQLSHLPQPHFSIKFPLRHTAQTVAKIVPICDRGIFTQQNNNYSDAGIAAINVGQRTHNEKSCVA